MVNNMLVLYFADGCPLFFVIFITDFKFCVKIVNVFHLCTKTIRKFSTVKYNNLVANKLQPYQLKKVRNTFNCIADFFNIRLNTIIMPFISPNT